MCPRMCVATPTTWWRWKTHWKEYPGNVSDFSKYPITIHPLFLILPPTHPPSLCFLICPWWRYYKSTVNEGEPEWSWLVVVINVSVLGARTCCQEQEQAECISSHRFSGSGVRVASSSRCSSSATTSSGCQCHRNFPLFTAWLPVLGKRRDSEGWGKNSCRARVDGVDADRGNNLKLVKKLTKRRQWATSASCSSSFNAPDSLRPPPRDTALI